MEEEWREGRRFKKIQSQEEGRSSCQVERMKEEGSRSCVKVELKIRYDSGRWPLLPSDIRAALATTFPKR
jgi:hypothetical protein